MGLRGLPKREGGVFMSAVAFDPSLSGGAPLLTSLGRTEVVLLTRPDIDFVVRIPLPMGDGDVPGRRIVFEVHGVGPSGVPPPSDAPRPATVALADTASLGAWACSVHPGAGAGVPLLVGDGMPGPIFARMLAPGGPQKAASAPPLPPPRAGDKGTLISGPSSRGSAALLPTIVVTPLSVDAAAVALGCLRMTVAFRGVLCRANGQASSPFVLVERPVGRSSGAAPSSAAFEPAWVSMPARSGGTRKDGAPSAPNDSDSITFEIPLSALVQAGSNAPKTLAALRAAMESVVRFSISDWDDSVRPPCARFA